MFYPWLWRVLPGNVLTKVLLLSGLGVAFIWLLFTWVFPALDLFFATDPTIES